MKTEPIKLTFKSGSLWYGEYEVVNPEVLEADCSVLAISTKRHWGRMVETGEPRGFVPYVDGDQITLPDGYGIDKHYQADSGPLVRRVSITLPEKPENSAHGYTELLSKEQFNSPANQNRDNAIVGFIKTGLDKIDESGLQLTNQDKAQLLNKRIENLSMVKPSESQEEIAEYLLTRWREIYKVEDIKYDEDYHDAADVNILMSRTLVRFVKEIQEKFTITRK